MMALDNIIPFAHRLLGAHIRPGDTVVDATAGNGHDTLFLAQCVGDEGCVYAFDVAEEALMATGARLAAAGAAKPLRLIHAKHERMPDYVASGVAAVVFNCGYLPGANKARTTQAKSTLLALQHSLALLKVGAVVCLVLYPGHEAGALEASAVLAWASELPQQQYAVLHYQFCNRQNKPPFLVAIEKLPSS